MSSKEYIGMGKRAEPGDGTAKECPRNPQSREDTRMRVSGGGMGVPFWW